MYDAMISGDEPSVYLQHNNRRTYTKTTRIKQVGSSAIAETALQGG